MSGSELQVKPFLSSNPGQGFFAAMRGTVIEHDIKFFVWISLQQTTKKPNESSTVVTQDRLTLNLSTVNFQGGQQRGGAVALIFVTETFNLVRFYRQPRLGAIQRLDRSFFIDRQTHCIFRRVEIQPDHRQ